MKSRVRRGKLSGEKFAPPRPRNWYARVRRCSTGQYFSLCHHESGWKYCPRRTLFCRDRPKGHSFCFLQIIWVEKAPEWISAISAKPESTEGDNLCQKWQFLQKFAFNSLQKEAASAEDQVFLLISVLSELSVSFWFRQKLATSQLALSVSAETLSVGLYLLLTQSSFGVWASVLLTMA